MDGAIGLRSMKAATCMKTTCLAAIPMLLCPVFAMAQTTQGGPATEMWGVGTNASGTTDASGSAYMHYYNSLIASGVDCH
jgi:hypothetical protein